MKKFIAVIIMLLFWAVMPLSFLLFNLKATFLNVDYYKTQLISNNTYQKAVDTVESGLDVSSMGIPVDLDLSGVFSTVWLQTEVEKVLDGTIGLLTPGTQISKLGEVTINFQEPKQNADQVLQDKLSTLPTCTDEQTQMMPNPEEDMENALPHLECIPIGASISELSLDEIIPGEQNLLALLDPKEGDLEEWQEYLDTAHYVIGIVILVMIIGFVLSAIFYMLLGLLFVKQMKSMLRWWGNALLTPAIFGLVTFIPAKLYLMFQTSELMLNILQIPPQAQAFSILLNEIVYALVNGFINRMLIPIIICFVLGVILLIVAKFVKNKPKTAPVPQAPAPAQPPAQPQV